MQERDTSFSLITAVVLWVFGGMVGVHRFFTRDYFVGIALACSGIGLPVLLAVSIGQQSHELGAVFLVWVLLHGALVFLDGVRLFFDKRARR